MKAKVVSLEELLRISRHTIQTLQTKLADLEASYQEKVLEQSVRMREIDAMLKEINQSNDALSRQELISKLERMTEIAKTEDALTRRRNNVWTPSTFGDIKVSIQILTI